MNSKIDLILCETELNDLELLLCGGFEPLKGYMREKDYKSVLSNMRLSTGEIWPIPIILKINSDEKKKYKKKEIIIIKNQQNVPLAELHNFEIYKPDLKKECLQVFKSDDTNHPYISKIFANKDVLYIGGDLKKIDLPSHYDFKDLRLTPKETREYFLAKGWTKIIGFQTRNPLHKCHYELIKNSVDKVPGSKVLLHPVVGKTQNCDIAYFKRVKCYKKLLKYFPKDSIKLSLLPLNMRMAGPREALLHALIRKNYGCTHFIVGRDHAGPSFKKKNGQKFFGPYDAHNLLESFKDELGIKILKSKHVAYVEKLKKYMTVDKIPKNLTARFISGTKFRAMLKNNEKVPDWFSFPEIIQELKTYYKPNHQKGFCLYFVGLSGAGKSTLANIMQYILLELTDRVVTILDGDIVRRNLSKGLTFSKKDRSINVRRIGYVASEIVKHGGIAICANIAPYEEDRRFNRKLISNYGGYFQIFVDTPLEKCEERDIKGLYKLARKGVIKNFTGISDPFEKPNKNEIILDGSKNDAIDSCIKKIIDKLLDKQYLIN